MHYNTIMKISQERLQELIDWKDKDPEGYKEYNREYQREYRKKNPKKAWLNQVKHRAKRNGIEFTIDDLGTVFVPAKCPLLEIPLEFGGDNKDNSPSLDRIDSSKGYTPENTWVISYKANRIKNNATTQELLTLAMNMHDFFVTKKKKLYVTKSGSIPVDQLKNQSRIG